MGDSSPDDVRGVIAAARAHAAAQRDEARALEAELPALNERLGIVRARQEHMQHPSTVVTEALPERIDRWLARLRIRRVRP